MRVVAIFFSTMGILSFSGWLLSGEQNANELWFQILSGAMLIGFALLLVRGLMVGVLVTNGGIFVRNFFRSFHLDWHDIAGFELRANRLSLTPAVPRRRPGGKASTDLLLRANHVRGRGLGQEPRRRHDRRTQRTRKVPQ